MKWGDTCNLIRRLLYVWRTEVNVVGSRGNELLYDRIGKLRHRLQTAGSDNKSLISTDFAELGEVFRWIMQSAVHDCQLLGKLESIKSSSTLNCRHWKAFVIAKNRPSSSLLTEDDSPKSAEGLTMEEAQGILGKLEFYVESQLALWNEATVSLGKGETNASKVTDETIGSFVVDGASGATAGKGKAKATDSGAAVETVDTAIKVTGEASTGIGLEGVKDKKKPRVKEAKAMQTLDDLGEVKPLDAIDRLCGIVSRNNDILAAMLKFDEYFSNRLALIPALQKAMAILDDEGLQDVLSGIIPSQGIRDLGNSEAHPPINEVDRNVMDVEVEGDSREKAMLALQYLRNLNSGRYKRLFDVMCRFLGPIYNFEKSDVDSVISIEVSFLITFTLL
jgi:hypothetical protein